MTLHVVDASFVIMWFVEEIHAEAAQRLQDVPYKRCAPARRWLE
jgi:hypothetical protein